MKAVNFKSNAKRNLSAIEFRNFQGVNCVDNNAVLPANQVPYAYNVDFGRQIGAASKRYGLENIIDDLTDVESSMEV